mmetsp:Transcript_133204/g.230528  ORF Transcript_133204/g.230528 Transcript_133204/m.230528 type:complete len:201 (-) Transcript_133204:278-880(-)
MGTMMPHPSRQRRDPESTLNNLHRANMCLLLHSTTAACSACMSSLLESEIAWCAPHPLMEEAWRLHCPTRRLHAVSLCQVVASTNGLGCSYQLAGNRRARRQECKKHPVEHEAKFSHPNTAALHAQSSKCGHPMQSHRCGTRSVPCGGLRLPPGVPQYCQPRRPFVALKESYTARLLNLQDLVDSVLGLHTSHGIRAPAM